MTNLTSSLNLDGEDFETEASKIRTKIETYFSQLIEVIKLRKSTLISELDNILSRYRKEREMNRNQMRELEKMRKFHEELYSTSTFKNLQDDVLSSIDTELATLIQTMDSIVIEFEWNQKYASEANNIGKLTSNAIYSAQPLQFRHSSSVSKDTDPIPPTRPRYSNLPQKPKQVVTEVNTQSIQQPEFNFNLGSVKKNTDSFTQHRSSESDWVTEEQSPLIHNSCTHGTFGNSSTNNLSDSQRPPPFKPAFP